jgi:hypothetical protein
MKGYDIKKIKFKAENSPEIEEKLTGKVITELENQSKVQPNAELEGKEYIQFPDGVTQLVAGNSHNKGGVKMNIPDGSKIVSASLTLTGDQAKEIRDKYEINVKAKATYADAITKYVKKIGLEAIYNDEEDLYKTLDKELKREGVAESTRLVNQEYLSGKVHELQLQKKKLEQRKSEFFNVVFDMQEETKPKKAKSDEGELKYGGVSEQNFKKLCKEHGISEEQGRVLLGEKVPSFDEGGEFGKLKKKYNTEDKLEAALKEGKVTDEQYNRLANILIENERTIFTTESGAHGTYSDEEIMKRVHQSKTDSGFGKVTKENIGDIMLHYYMNFPEAANKHLGVKMENGDITWDKTIDFSKANDRVRAFQKDADAVMRASDNSILDEKSSKYFSEEFRDIARKHLDNETFIDDKKSVRDYDGKIGSFTSGRYINKVNTVTPEELENLHEKKIFTRNQLQEALKDDPTLISEDSKKRIKELGDLSLDGSDFGINSFNPRPAEEPEEVKEEIKEGVLDNEPVAEPKGYFPQLFGGPNEYPSAPYPMDAHLMGESRFQRMDPVRVGIEPQIQEAGEQRKFVAKQMFGNLSPNVAASVMANQMANQTKAINAEARAANMTNAQNLASTELFNIGQAGKESEANLRNKLSFEQRQLMAKANFQEEMKRWEDQVRRININKYKNNQGLNLMNQMFPDYNVGFGGSTVKYTPEQLNQIIKANPEYFESFGKPPTA